DARARGQRDSRDPHGRRGGDQGRLSGRGRRVPGDVPQGMPRGEDRLHGAAHGHALRQGADELPAESTGSRVRRRDGIREGLEPPRRRDSTEKGRESRTGGEESRETDERREFERRRREKADREGESFGS